MVYKHARVRDIIVSSDQHLFVVVFGVGEVRYPDAILKGGRTILSTVLPPI